MTFPLLIRLLARKGKGGWQGKCGTHKTCGAGCEKIAPPQATLYPDKVIDRLHPLRWWEIVPVEFKVRMTKTIDCFFNYSGLSPGSEVFNIFEDSFLIFLRAPSAFRCR
jgi:hypothetical protein